MKIRIVLIGWLHDLQERRFFQRTFELEEDEGLTVTDGGDGAGVAFWNDSIDFLPCWSFGSTR